ncbi:MAG: ATP-binding protein [Chloroflexi bacterium]|nr:ATP-binding protein [Chloroflexota bacterium]
MLWADSCLRILRTFIFGPASGAFNARHPIKLEDLLTHPVIFELVQELPKPLRVFFSDVILRWTHLYRLGQGETHWLRHVTVLEEVHNLFPKTNLEKQVTNSLENIFREIRGFGKGLVNITQHPSLRMALTYDLKLSDPVSYDAEGAAPFRIKPVGSTVALL